MGFINPSCCDSLKNMTDLSKNANDFVDHCLLITASSVAVITKYGSQLGTRDDDEQCKSQGQICPFRISKL